MQMDRQPISADKRLIRTPLAELFQVFAVYPSGNRYPVRAPHAKRGAAALHVEWCQRDADARDTWTYCFEKVEAPLEGVVGPVAVVGGEEYDPSRNTVRDRDPS